MLYIIFQYGWEPVLIHRILFGIKTILSTILQSNSKYLKYTTASLLKDINGLATAKSRISDEISIA